MSGPMRHMKRHSQPKPRAHTAWRELYLSISNRIDLKQVVDEKSGQEGFNDEDGPVVLELMEIKKYMDTLAAQHNLI